MVLFSNTTGYALRALAAMPPDGSFIRARDLADKVGLPAPYLAKIMYSLSTRGLLESVRGPGGGIRLARPAQQIALADVVEALGGGEILSGCQPPSGAEDGLRTRSAWDELVASVALALAEMTVQDLKPREEPSTVGRVLAWGSVLGTSSPS